MEQHGRSLFLSWSCFAEAFCSALVIDQYLILHKYPGYCRNHRVTLSWQIRSSCFLLKHSCHVGYKYEECYLIKLY